MHVKSPPGAIQEICDNWLAYGSCIMHLNCTEDAVSVDSSGLN